MDRIVMIILAVVYIAWNLLVFFLYGLDKQKARRGQWRISERMLMGSAILMGGLGALYGMKLFRHKTKHMKFRVGVPLAFLFNLGIAAGVIYFIVVKVIEL